MGNIAQNPLSSLDHAQFDAVMVGLNHNRCRFARCDATEDLPKEARWSDVQQYVQSAVANVLAKATGQKGYKILNSDGTGLVADAILHHATDYTHLRQVDPQTTADILEERLRKDRRDRVLVEDHRSPFWNRATVDELASLQEGGELRTFAISNNKEGDAAWKLFQHFVQTQGRQLHAFLEAELPFLATLDATRIRTYHNDVRAAVWNILGTKTLLDAETRTSIRHAAEAAWVKAYDDDPLSHIHRIAQEEGRRVYDKKRREQLEQLPETDVRNLCASYFGAAPDTARVSQLITLIVQHERRHPEAQAQVLPDVETGDTRKVLNAYFADLLATENPTPEDHARARKLLPIMEWHLWQLFDAGERQVYEELRGQLNGLLLKYDIIFREQEGAYAMYLALAMKDPSFTRNKLAGML